jgi:D-glycero-D-manno-heptose 1,7-bisphosphate phosphatase
VRARRAVAAALTAVFLDRDGVINRKPPEGEYVTSWAQFELLPGALEGLRALSSLDVPIVVVTNQRGIARGRMTEADLADIHARMLAAVEAAGGRVDAVYHCPHAVGTCGCRKPLPGMFQRAAKDLGLVLDRSVVVGDQHSDMEAAGSIGALRVAVGDAIGTDSADHAARDLLAAARWLTA